MSISELSGWVRCPNCLLDLDVVGERTLGCAAGHRFDLHRHGYATLLAPRAPAHRGDDRRMLVARDAVLRSGIYSPIVDAVVDATEAALASDGASPRRVVDFGCGTGWYSGALAARSIRPTQLLMSDRSPSAVRWATLGAPGSLGVVLDVWQPLPLRDAVADAALDVFAPRNPPEFARVLRQGGVLTVVVPRPDHLHELRSRGRLLEVPEGKSESILATFAEWFEPIAVRRVTARREFTVEQAAAVAEMGPSAHHRGADDAALEAPAGGVTGTEPAVVAATLDVDVVTLRRS